MTYEKIIDKTPSGGDYSEIFYLDDKGNSTDSDKATHCIIRECKNDGTLLKETFGKCNQQVIAGK